MELKPGRYRHFKGNEYELIGIAKDSETLEPMVVYKALYGEGGLWVRPASMWTEKVEKYLAFWREVWYTKSGQVCVCARLNIIG